VPHEEETMESHNPILSRAEGFRREGYAGFRQGTGRAATPTATAPWNLEQTYAGPAATARDTGRMTYDDVVVRTAIVLGAVVLGAAVGWFVPALTLPGMIVGFVLGLVNSFKRNPSPPLILAYGVFEGLFLGGVSSFFQAQWNGIVVQAVLATMVTFAVMLGLYRSRVLRATPKFTRIVVGATIGYALFSLINFAFALFGSGLGVWSGGLGLLVGGVGAVLAALYLVLDFDMVERGVANGLPERYAWTAAFGLTVTLVWLYLEFLRILSILRGQD
jgi:uncharacterized YccA/Bax inhibitor family protein